MTPSTSLRADATVIALVGVAHATSHLFHLLLPPLFPLLMPDFGFGYTEAGFLMTVFFAISGMGQAFAGIVVDRYGARRVLMAGVSLLAASGIALSVAASYPMLLLAVALAGAGNSVFHPADFSLLNKKVSPARLGYAFSVHGLSGNLGWAIGATISGMALAWAGWRGAGVAAALVALVSVAALKLARPLLDDDLARTGAGGAAVGATFAFLSAPVIWMAFLFFLLITAAFGGLQSFSAPVLGGIYGLSPAAGAAALTGYLLGSAAGMVIGGQKLVTFELVNQGGATSGPVQVVLPQVPWLAVAGTNPLPALAPGQTNSVTLQLTPPADLALTAYDGQLAVLGGAPAIHYSDVDLNTQGPISNWMATPEPVA